MYFKYTLFKLYVYANIFFIAQVWFWGRGQLVFWGASKFSNLLALRATASTSLMSRPGTTSNVLLVWQDKMRDGVLPRNKYKTFCCALYII